MKTRRASYSHETSPTHNRETSPKRRKLDSPTQSSSQETAPSKEPQSTKEIDPDPEKEDQLIDHLLQKAEKNLKSNPRQSTQVTQPPRPLPLISPSSLNGTSKQTTSLTTSTSIVPAGDISVKRLLPPPSRKEREMQKISTAGEKWFDLPATEVTPGIKRDLQLLQMRDVLDPKRFYRASSKKLPKYFQMGRIIEGPTDFFGGRMKKRERKETIVQEVLADQKSGEYFKKKYQDIQEKSNSGGKKWYKQQQERKKRK